MKINCKKDATAEGIPATRSFSRQLVAYIAALLPSARFYQARDSRIAGICDEQYTSTLETLHKTDDEKFKDSSYLTRKTQAPTRPRVHDRLPSPLQRLPRSQRRDADADASPGAGSV
jgi:hypothetical protein